MENINEAGHVIANANLENAEDRNDQMLPEDLGFQCGIFLYILYPPIKETTELQLLIGISYEIGLCVALILAYPFYRVLLRWDHHWRGWLIELTLWNSWEFELYLLCPYAIYSLLLFLRMPFAILIVFMICLLYAKEIANANLENAEDRNDQAMPNRIFLLITCTIALYVLYPVVKDMAELQLLIGISYEVGLCVALILLYPFFRVFPRFWHHWRGLAIELTRWNRWEYEFYMFRLYAAFSLSMFLHIPLSLLALFLVFAHLPFRYRIASVVLVASVSYLWCYDVWTSGSLYELRNLSWTSCLLLIIVYVCSIRNAALVFRPIL